MKDAETFSCGKLKKPKFLIEGRGSIIQCMHNECPRCYVP